MPDFDPFHFYRLVLTLIVAIYCVIQTVVSTLYWVGWGSEDVREIGVVRRYAVVLLLRTRIRRFFVDGLSIAGLIVLLWLLIEQHGG